MNNVIQEERDKSEWIKCKDILQNYEYISISSNHLSIILKIGENIILNALKDKQPINNRFIVTKFIEDEKE